MIKCIGGPRNGQYTHNNGESFEFMDNRAVSHLYTYNAAHGVYVCQTKEEYKWDCHYYAIPVGGTGISTLYVDVPCRHADNSDVSHVSLAYLMSMDMVDKYGLADITLGLLDALIDKLSNPRVRPRSWNKGEADMLRATRID